MQAPFPLPPIAADINPLSVLFLFVGSLPLGHSSISTLAFFSCICMGLHHRNSSRSHRLHHPLFIVIELWLSRYPLRFAHRLVLLFLLWFSFSISRLA